jgi:hypothetical protein
MRRLPTQHSSPTSERFPNISSIALCLLALFHNSTHAALPTEAGVKRFMQAYPAGKLFEVGLTVTLRTWSTTPIQKSRTACILNHLDTAVLEDAALMAAGEYFTDNTSLRGITEELESPGGRKLVASLLAASPGPNGSPLFPDAGYTPDEWARLERFKTTQDFALFRRFGDSVGSKIQLNDKYRSMMSHIRESCSQ